MADDKKNFDDDKTVIDIRPPAPSQDEDRTVIAPREPAPPAEPVERTVRWAPGSTPAPPADEDRTVIRSSAPAATPSDDRTMIRGGDAPGVAAAPAGEFAIVVLSGAGKGGRYPVPASGALAGSGPGCQVPLAGTFPQHARLAAQGDGLEVQALGGPVTVRGREVTNAQLKSGDLFKIADVVVRVVKAGDVFSSAYTEAELSGGGGLDLAGLTKNPKMLAIGALVVALLGVLFWPASEPEPEAPAPAGPDVSDQRRKDVDALLASGEVLFNAGRFVAPPDQPDAENAYRAFNRVIEIDPGNDRAREWLERIDAELQKEARARQEADAARRAREREAEEQKRAALAGKIAGILAEGDALFARGNVAEPVGANALVKYREALAIDPESREALERERKAIYYYVEKGDELREKDDLWRALENYRKAARASEKNPDIAARVKDAEARLRSLMSGTSTDIVMYKDDRGQLFVLDDKNKVPARYKDRMVEVTAASPTPAE